MSTDLGGLPRPEDIAVLVVDDDYSVLEVVTEFLSGAGYRVSATTSGADACNLLRSGRFHVLLADLRMSPVSGWEVIRAAREEAKTEVIVMTGYASLDSSLEALHQGVFDFLQKPLDFERLDRAVRNAANHNALTRRSRELLENLSARNRELEEEVRKIRGEMEARSLFDPVTGLPDHRGLPNVLAGEIARSLRHHHPLALVALSLDRFEALLERQGEEAGNRALARAAAILREDLRRSDTACRVAGGEFEALLPMTAKAEAERVIGRVVGEVRRAGIDVGDGRVLTCSAGIAVLPDDAESAEELLRLARGALREAQARSGDRLVLASGLSFR